MSACRRCHRPIRSQWVISPACLKKEQLAAMAAARLGYSGEQVGKATALLESKGVDRVTGGYYRTRSSDERTWYRTSAWDCSCPRQGRGCYHVLAVKFTEAVLRAGGLYGPLAGFKTSRKAA